MDRNELVREVYAHFGLAIYEAQVLEHGLANAMLLARMAAGKLPTLADFDAFLEARFKKTLGSLIKDLSNHIAVDAGLEGMLAAALEKRNWLAHRYFRERSETFMSDRGCATMIAELESAQALFHEADEALEGVTKTFAAKVGVTDARLEAMVAEITRKAQADG
jgi:hypothetical protein